MDERSCHVEDDECPNPRQEQNQREDKKYKPHQQTPLWPPIISLFGESACSRGPRATFRFSGLSHEIRGRLQKQDLTAHLKSARQTCGVHHHKILHEQQGEARDLRAKMLLFANEPWEILFADLSKFTAAGVAGSQNRGNLQANPALRIKRGCSKGACATQTLPL